MKNRATLCALFFEISAISRVEWGGKTLNRNSMLRNLPQNGAACTYLTTLRGFALDCALFHMASLRGFEPSIEISKELTEADAMGQVSNQNCDETSHGQNLTSSVTIETRTEQSHTSLNVGQEFASILPQQSFPADLSAVVSAWPGLPEYIKSAVLALVSTVKL